MGKWELTDCSAWTSGFYLGCLWLGNQLISDAKLLNSAVRFTEGLEEEQYTTSHHDMGFLILNSYGHAYKQTQNE